jgi:hypothetical protein
VADGLDKCLEPELVIFIMVILYAVRLLTPLAGFCRGKYRTAPAKSGIFPD